MAEKRTAETNESPSKRAKLDDTNGTAHHTAPNDPEEAVGISAFVSPETPGFRCIVKQRYTDFLVNEILPTGEVVHLTELPETKRRPQQKAETHASTSDGSHDTPATTVQDSAEPVKVEPVPTLETNGEDASMPDDADEVSVPALSEEDKQILHDIFGEGTTAKITDLYAAIIKRPDRKARDHVTVRSDIISDKSKRTEAHGAIRRIFQSKLQTETMQDQVGVIAVKAAATRGPGGPRGQPNGTDRNGAITKGKLGWSELGGEYLHFTLYKENKDTMEVLYFMAAQLKVPVKNFQFAGTKDRRGVTVQKVAIHRMHAHRIVGLNRLAKNWVASGFEHKKHGLDLGELTGNEFLLTLRDCQFDGEEGLDGQQRLELAKDKVAAAAASFRNRGFLNYYGLQRFGTFSTGTHVVGLKMLQGDLEGAVDSILAYSPNLLLEDEHTNFESMVPQDDINRAAAIRTWRETGQAGPELVSRMPRRFQAELSIIQYLSRKDRRTGKQLQDRDWQGALMQIQRNLRLMYVHAYQSLVWNTAAGRRWELYGDKVVEGDLVIVGEKDGDASGKVKEEVDEDGEPIVRPAADDSALSAEDNFVRARPISKEEAESGKYDIFDVVLPQPGFDVLYPANAIGKFYEEFMGSEAGGKLDPHNMRRTWKDISLSGGYRKVMARPLRGLVECEVKQYAGGDEQMVETDLERLKREQAEAQAGGSGDVNGGDKMDVDTVGRGHGEASDTNIAVVMKFQLGSSQYATMALRELTKGGAAAYKPDYSTTR
ncbi:hypothetical protein LTR36_003493 [Oleoguttula mirabilis]|uniref:TRUD domain-containing protein n=1 Tax=Oleoguttula mirabilis TaxID=1507867 RepID=A0AAV9JJH5_9PEZI|nr:hypothetical protein LTR36_003493 [Oleoguttula mirabilis]